MTILDKVSLSYTIDFNRRQPAHAGRSNFHPRPTFPIGFFHGEKAAGEIGVATDTADDGV